MVWLQPKMSLANKTSKENFRLLDLSSEEESDDLHLEIIPRKKKVSRRERNKSSTTKLAEPILGTEIQCALRWAMRGTILLWLLMLTWICASLYDQVSTMHIEMVKVKESSESVADALQFCHTASQQLRANATDFGHRLGRLEQLYHELARRGDAAGGEAAAVAQQLASAPQLVDTPRRLAELQRTVADFGSQINSFESSLNTAHQLSTDVKEVKTLVTQVQERSNYALGNATDSVRKGEELRVELAALKESLKAMQTTTATPSTTVATTASTTTSTTAATSTTSSTTTPPPEPPAKPAVLQ